MLADFSQARYGQRWAVSAQNARTRRVTELVTRLQAVVRGRLARQAYQRQRAAALRIQVLGLMLLSGRIGTSKKVPPRLLDSIWKHEFRERVAVATHGLPVKAGQCVVLCYCGSRLSHGSWCGHNARAV